VTARDRTRAVREQAEGPRTAVAHVRVGYEVAGRALSEAAVLERVGWLCALVREIADASVRAHWKAADLATLCDVETKFAYKAYEKLWQTPDAPKDVYASSRVRRVAAEVAGRIMRSARDRSLRIDALLAQQPDQPLNPLIAASFVWSRSLRKRLEKYERQHTGPAHSLFDLEPIGPTVPGHSAPMAPCDDQHCVYLTTVQHKVLVLRVQLPLVARPVDRAQWCWCDLELPLAAPLAGTPHLPTFRLSGGRVLADIAVDRPGEPMPTFWQQPASRVLGLDWGINCFLTGAVCAGVGEQFLTDGHVIRFDGYGLIGKLHRLRQQVEAQSAKLDAYSRLRTRDIADAPLPDDYLAPHEDLRHRRAVLWEERRHTSRRMTVLNRALAHLAARWAVEQAKAQRCDTIALEDLSTLVPKIGRKMNARISLSTRSLISQHIAQQARDVGIRTVLVYPRDTSRLCPGCQRPVHHCPSPDRRHESGYAWLCCAHCGWSCDRDHGGAENIGARGVREGRPKAYKVELEEALAAAAVAGAPAVVVAEAVAAQGKRAKQQQPAKQQTTYPLGTRVHTERSRQQFDRTTGGPNRGHNARVRRLQQNPAEHERRRAWRAATPPAAPSQGTSTHRVGEPSAAAAASKPTGQPGTRADQQSAGPTRVSVTIRRLVGLRAAYNGRVRCSPIRDRLQPFAMAAVKFA
jgi:IS605 OrfB family transposase